MNTLITTIAALGQGVSGFYYLNKHLNRGVERGWVELVSAENIVRAPRKSLFVWITCTAVLLASLVSQFAILIESSNTHTAPVMFGFFLASMNVVSLVGIFMGLVFSGLFGGSRAEILEELEDEDEPTHVTMMGRVDGDASPLRRRG